MSECINDIFTQTWKNYERTVLVTNERTTNVLFPFQNVETLTYFGHAL